MTLLLSVMIQATPAVICDAFTHDLLLAQWLAHDAKVFNRQAYLLRWDDGFYVTGEFTVLEYGRRLGFTWQGRDEPGRTHVEVRLTRQDEGTQVQVRQSGFGESEAWDDAARRCEARWAVSLASLKIALEYGEDLCLLQRPMLGIFPTLLDEATAAHLKVSIKQGFYIGGVIEGLDAAQAGLQTGDVIVSIDGTPMQDYAALQAVVEARKPGDVLAVEVYRGSNKRDVELRISPRPTLRIPTTPVALAEMLQATYAELDAELDQLVRYVAESEMARQPGEGEWSAKEVLAHLIWTERYNQMYLWGVVSNEKSVTWTDNNPTQLVGTLAVYPTTVELVAELKRAEAATVAMVAGLPAGVLENKRSYNQMAQHLLSVALHTRQHFEQIRRSFCG
jgi:uncharacterized protein YndB with AHSA1/START domain